MCAGAIASFRALARLTQQLASHGCLRGAWLQQWRLTGRLGLSISSLQGLMLLSEIWIADCKCMQFSWSMGGSFYQLQMASASRTCWVFLMHSAETPDINSADTLGVLPPATTGFWTVKRGTCQGVFPNPHKSQAIQAKLTCPVCLVSYLRTVSDQLLSYLQTRAHSSPVLRGHREKRSPAQNSV